MKSKRAKEYIQDKDNQLWGVSMGVPLYITFDVEKAVALAEQDAEERVLNVVAKWLKKTYHDYAVDDDFIPEIKNLLNNGGQSDE